MRTCRYGFFRRRGRPAVFDRFDLTERKGLVVDDLGGRLVFAKALERRMPQQPLVRPVRELDLGDKRRLDPRNVRASPVVPERLEKGDRACSRSLSFLCSAPSVFWLNPVPTRPA